MSDDIEQALVYEIRVLRKASQVADADLAKSSALATPDGGSDLREPLDLDAIRARAEAATEGPWFGSGGGLHVYGATPGDQVAECARRRDADFIQHARSDVPALLAEVERLRAALMRTAQDSLEARMADQEARIKAERERNALAAICEDWSTHDTAAAAALSVTPVRFVDEAPLVEHAEHCTAQSCCLQVLTPEETP